RRDDDGTVVRLARASREPRELRRAADACVRAGPGDAGDGERARRPEAPGGLDLQLVRGDADVLILAVDDRGRGGALGELEVVSVLGRERQRDAAVDELPLLGRVVPGADATVVLLGRRPLDLWAGLVARCPASRRGVRDVR